MPRACRFAGNAAGGGAGVMNSQNFLDRSTPERYPGNEPVPRPREYGTRLARSLNVLETQGSDHEYLAAYFWIRLA